MPSPPFPNFLALVIASVGSLLAGFAMTDPLGQHIAFLLSGLLFCWAILVLLFPTSFLVFHIERFWNRQQTKSGSRSEQRSGRRNALQIILGTEGDFETRKASGLYKTTHTFKVSLKNEDCDQFISNCRFYLSIADKESGNKRDYALNIEPFTLNPTEERFFPIVSYEEPASVSGHAGEFIRLLIPVVGGYYGVGSGWPWQLPVDSYVFSLFATSKERGRAEVVCKIWVSHDKKLHFTRA